MNYPAGDFIDIAALGAIAGDTAIHADANADALQLACELGVKAGKPVLVSDVYQIGSRSAGVNPQFIFIELGEGESLDLIVPGTLKEKDGKTKAIGRYNKMVYIKVVGHAERLRISGNFDKNARGSFGEVPSVEEPYFYQQSHTIQIDIAADASLKNLAVDGHFRDKTAGHIVIAGGGSCGPVLNGLVERSTFDGWNPAHGLAQRGDIEMQGAGWLSVVECRGDYLQTEPNGGGYTAGKPLSLTVRGGEWGILDLVGITSDQPHIEFVLDRAKVTAGLNIADATVRATCVDAVYSATNPWKNVKGSFDNGVLRLPVAGGAVAAPIRPRTGSGGIWDMEFINTELRLHDDGVGQVTGFLLSGTQANGLAAARAIRTTFTNCRFDPRVEHIADAYRHAGTVIVRGGAPQCFGYGFRVGGTTTPHYGFLELYDVDFRGIGGHTVMISGPSSNFGLRIAGRYLASEVSFALENSASLAHVDGCDEVIFPALVADAVPVSGFGLRGLVIEKRRPASAAAPGWLCTASHATNGGVWTELACLPA